MNLIGKYVALVEIDFGRNPLILQSEQCGRIVINGSLTTAIQKNIEENVCQKQAAVKVTPQYADLYEVKE